MTREYSEEAILRLGARSLGVHEGASEGDVLAFDANGEIAPTASNGGSSPVLEASLALTSAHIKALHTTPLQIVPAPGAGSFLVLLAGSGLYTFGSVPYATDTTVRVGYAGFGGADPTYEYQLAIDGSADQWNVQTRVDDGGPPTRFENLGLVVFAFANPTAGDGTLIVRVTYTVHSFT